MKSHDGFEDVRQVPNSPKLKWAGGQSRLLPHILPRLPARMQTYYELFLGGGAAFFALADQDRFERAVLGELNPALLELYTVVRDQVDAFIEAIAALLILRGQS